MVKKKSQLLVIVCLIMHVRAWAGGPAIPVSPFAGVASTPHVGPTPTQPVPAPVQVAPAVAVQQPPHPGFGAPVTNSFMTPPVAGTTDAQNVTTTMNATMAQPTKDSSQSEEDQLVLGELDTEQKFSSGNWLKKREIWEKIEEVYDEIKAILVKITTARTSFVSQRNKLDRELDIFFSQMGFEAGPLQDIITRSLDILKTEQKDHGMLNKIELAFKEKIDSKERDLEQLKLNIKSLQELDAKIDEALDTLFEQIDVANKYEQKAWQIFKDVARELDDKVALVGYYQTEGLLKDITNVHDYLTKQFASYFTQQIQSAQQHSQTITSEMQALKDIGVDFKKFSTELEKEHDAFAAEKRGDAERQAALEKAKEEKDKAEAAAKKQHVIVRSYHSVKGLFVTVAHAVFNFLSSIVSTVQSWFSRGGPVVLSKERELGLKVEAAEKAVVHAVKEEIDEFDQWIHHAQDEVKQEEESLPLIGDHDDEEFDMPEHYQMHQSTAPSFEEPKQRPVSVMPTDEHKTVNEHAL